MVPPNGKSSGNKRKGRQNKILQQLTVKLETNEESVGDNPNELDNSQATDKLSNCDKRIIRKHATRFQKSGMKAGSLLNYFVKKNPEEQVLPEIDSNYSLPSNAVNETVVPSTSRISPNCSNRMDEIDTQSNAGSDIEIIDEKPIRKQKKPPEVVDLTSSSGTMNDIEADVEIEIPEEGDTSDRENQQHPCNHSKISDGPSNNTNPIVSQTRARQQRKRKWNNAAGQSDEFQPLPSKNMKCSDMQSQIQTTPDRDNQQLPDADSLTPPLKIVNTYTLCSTTSPSTIPHCLTSDIKENAKRKVLVFKERDNPEIQQMIKKGKWGPMLEIMGQDLKKFIIPLKSYVIKVIRQTVLNETRVNKKVASLAIAFLQNLTEEYPAGKDESIRYYEEIFKMIFRTEDEGGIENATTLFDFFKRVCQRVESGAELDPKNVQFLLIVTNLVEKQYEFYKNEPLKVRPPFLQLFLEKIEGKLDYRDCCQNIVNKLFTVKKNETFCIYVRWVDMIAKHFHCHKPKEFQQMVDDVKQQCLKELPISDLTLKIFMNLKYYELSIQVCKEIFHEKLSFERISRSNVHISTNQPSTSSALNPSPVTKLEMYSYLAHLAGTYFICPALGVVSNETKQFCGPDNSLEFISTAAEGCSNRQTNDDKRNIKGETKFHISGRLDKGGVEDPLGYFKNLLKTIPKKINDQDNFGNTVLHDCARYDRQPTLVAIRERASTPGSELAVDLLIQNQSLETALHLAATFSNLDFVEVLKDFAIQLKVEHQLLLTPNAHGKVPFEVASSTEIKRTLLPAGYDEKKMFCYKGIRLTSESKQLLEDNFNLKKILAWWSKTKK